ncbi:MAG TPA: hypothetical protein VG099_18590 [Gemmataceae bacterium]|jgi:hypothetical protein|nr:hypothetical protein [Gemmataceae bacterium]
MDKFHGAMAVGRLVEISARNSARTSADQGAASAAEGPDRSLESWQEPVPLRSGGKVADPAFRRLMEERRKESDGGKVSSLEEVRQRLAETS